AESMGSQFFLVFSDTTLPSDSAGGYTVFGHITSGLQILKEIGQTGTADGSSDGRPAENVIIESVDIKSPSSSTTLTRPRPPRRTRQPSSRQPPPSPPSPPVQPVPPMTRPVRLPPVCPRPPVFLRPRRSPQYSPIPDRPPRRPRPPRPRYPA